MDDLLSLTGQVPDFVSAARQCQTLAELQAWTIKTTGARAALSGDEQRPINAAIHAYAATLAAKLVQDAITGAATWDDVLEAHQLATGHKRVLEGDALALADVDAALLLLRQRLHHLKPRPARRPPR